MWENRKPLAYVLLVAVHILTFRSDQSILRLDKRRGLNHPDQSILSLDKLGLKSHSTTCFYESMKIHRIVFAARQPKFSFKFAEPILFLTTFIPSFWYNVNLFYLLIFLAVCDPHRTKLRIRRTDILRFTHLMYSIL